MKKLKSILIAALLLPVLPMGCHSFRVQDYVSPRITGRVLDADSRAPVPNVIVRRFYSDRNGPSTFPPKGGERMLERDEVRTDPNGQFKMADEKNALTFGGGSAYSVRLLFQHSRYESVRTNYFGASITEAGPNRPPELNAGEIFLQRLPH
jgi:hypothetical protein